MIEMCDPSFSLACVSQSLHCCFLLLSFRLGRRQRRRGAHGMRVPRSVQCWGASLRTNGESSVWCNERGGEDSQECALGSVASHSL